MAYGYYTDPGTSFGNTGENTSQETFIQRQRRLQASQAQSQPQQPSHPTASPSPARLAVQPATGTTGTPVTGNGAIPPPSPAPPPAPAPQPAPAAAPVRANFRWGNGINSSSGYDPNALNGNTNSWTEADWQNYERVQGITPQAAPAAAAPAVLSLNDREKAVGIVDKGNNLVLLPSGAMVDRNHPLYQAELAKAPTASQTPAGTTAGAGSALSGPAQAATSGMFTQAAPPQHDFQNWQQLDLVSRLLANPQTMSPQVIEQMKQRSMEEALIGQREAAQQAAEEAAASGFAVNGGRVAAQQRASQEDMLNAIRGQNRDLEIRAAQQNRQDELNAAQLSEAILSGQVGRGSQVYGDVLAGQQANRGDYWTGKAQDLQRYGIDQGIAVDTSRIASGDRQFDARLREDARQSNNQMGFNWAQLGQNGQSALIQAILGTLK